MVNEVIFVTAQEKFHYVGYGKLSVGLKNKQHFHARNKDLVKKFPEPENVTKTLKLFIMTNSCYKKLTLKTQRVQ